jgi:trimethylamine-N-oxide reductase (cytochrome c)
MSGGGCSCRNIYAHEAMRMEVYLLAMQGWGAPGRHYCMGFTAPTSPRTPRVGAVGANAKITAAMGKELGVNLAATDRDRQFILVDDMYGAFNNPPIDWWFYDDPFYKRTYPMEGKSEVHMIWGTSSSHSGSNSCGNYALKALRSPKLECIVSQNMFLEDGMLFSDIILPIRTKHEVDDLPTVAAGDVCTTLILEKQAVKPVGEAKTDFAAVCEVAKKLNFLDKLTGGKEAEEIETERIQEGYENSGFTDLVSWEELNEKNYYSVSFEPNWNTPSLAFYNNPKGNPLPTPSGRLEFESRLLKDNFPDDKERLPVAHYVRGGPPEEGWTHDEDRLISKRAADYPLLVVANTSYYRHHSMRADIPWTRELDKVIGYDGYAYSPVWISKEDADARGIQDGDIVRTYNERGSVLGGAVISERIIPGAVCIQKAGGYDNIIPTELNRGGHINCISPKAGHSTYAYGLAPSGYLAQVEKVTGNQMDEWRKNYPDAFARDYDPAYGPLFSGWVEGGK